MSSLPLPPYYDAANAASTAGQKRYLRAIRLRLGALVVAALGGAVGGVGSVSLGEIDVFAWVALAGFVAALLVEFYIYAGSPDGLWYEGRAAAESVKTLTWRYVVRGNPFPASLTEDEARELLCSRLVEVSRDLRHEAIPTTPSTSDLVPRDLSEQRSSTFTARRDLYRQGRIDDQLDWYGDKARLNARRSQQFLLATLTLEFAGVVAAVLRVASVVQIDVLGIAAAVISGVAAWAQTRQYTTLSSAYSITARELLVVKHELTRCEEKDWAAFVERAEEAISREHTLWRSTRGVLDGRIRQ